MFNFKLKFMLYVGFTMKFISLSALNRILNYRYHYILVVFFITLAFLCFFNNKFWHDAYFAPILESNLPLSFKILSPIAVGLLFLSVFMLLFSYKYILKTSFILLFLTGSITFYATNYLGVLFDTTMIQNIFETNVSEAKSYFSLSAINYFIFLGVIPSIILFKIKIYYPKFFISWLQRILVIIVSLTICGTIVLSYYQQFSFIGRQNNHVTNLLIPSSYVIATVKYVKSTYFTPPLPYVHQGLNAKVESTTNKPKLIFLVLGETARANNFSVYGYERDTNVHTQKKQTFNFKNVSSCGTATAHSIPCMFTDLTRTEYSDKLAKNRDSVMDVLNRAGIDTVWIDNDGGCKGQCDRIKNITIKPDQHKQYCQNGTCFDEVMLDYATKFANTATKDTVVVFHLIGSHGPKYYERYPNTFKVYTPDCNRADVENCTLDEVRNAYDNTILYTDFINYKLIDILEQNVKNFRTSLLYISDHGESLGENGLFLHGTPYAIAPTFQTHVPMQLWMPQATSLDLKVNRTCLTDLANNAKLSHDNLYHSLLGLMEVKTSEYKVGLDIFAKCKLTN